MNGEIGIDDPRHNLMVYLAAKGIDTWALDYRTHFIPPATSESDLSELKGWTNELFESDIDAASAFVSASTHRVKLFVGGFSRGVTFAYLYAARHPDRVAGLVMLDGSISDHPMMPGSPSGNADDVGGKHLTFDKRKLLMQMVIANPDGPAPIPKYKTTRENLEHVVYDAAKFGGSGGLANPLGGFSDAPTLARVLVEDDRWWPSVQDYESSLTPELKQSLAGSKIPVIAFASTNMGSRFTSAVRAAASSTGSSDVSVHGARWMGPSGRAMRHQSGERSLRADRGLDREDHAACEVGGKSAPGPRSRASLAGPIRSIAANAHIPSVNPSTVQSTKLRRRRVAMIAVSDPSAALIASEVAISSGGFSR